MSNHKQYYMTAEEFFACLQDAWVTQHSDDVISEWHPEDLATGISSLAEGVGFFMSAFIKMLGKQ